MLKAQLGADIAHVPYNGQAPALADLLGGQVSVMFGNWPEFRGHVESGKLAPSATPASIIAQLNTEINKILHSSVVLEIFQKSGIASLSASPSQFSEFI
jgi:tripartite-type tricarboxylate transporter receptor subunit TctC